MTVLAILPMVVFFILIRFMFASDMMVNILRHTVERRSDGYRVHIFRKVEAEEESPDLPEWEEYSSLDVSDSSVVKRRFIDDYEALYLVGTPVRILFVPRYFAS